MLTKLIDQKEKTFNKHDDFLFIYKFLNRFGASTLSVLLASALCYPLDTIKRRMQLNGSIGHKNLYRDSMHCFEKIRSEEGLRGLYSGYTLNLCRTIPMGLIYFICFQNLKFITENNKQQL